MKTPALSRHSSFLSLGQEPDWYRALTLRERTPCSQLSPSIANALTSEQETTARLHLQRWQSQTPFGEKPFFSERLAADGLCEEDLLVLLGEQDEALRKRVIEAPDWLLELDRAFSHAMTLAAPPTLVLPEQAVDAQADPPLLLRPLWPLLLPAITRLREGIALLQSQWPELPIDAQRLELLLLASLPDLLLPKVSRTLVMELHVAKLRGHLQAETPSARFEQYLERLGQPEHLRALLQEYVVLARQLVQLLRQWVDYQLEWLGHLGQDWDLIQANLGPLEEPGILTDLLTGAGDTHRGGRSVLALTFASGWRLVYKPRSLTIDRRFQELLGWLNQQGQQPQLQQLRLLDRDTYGWSEYVEATACISQAEVARFYERQGAYLALLYALDATDFHYENVIAAGEHPILVDLEGLFHPHEPLEAQQELEQHPGGHAFINSVLRTGLLPVRLWANDQSEGIDISGLGGQGGQVQPRPAARWEAACTDEMRLVRQQVLMPDRKNRPHLRSEEVEPLHYSAPLLDGFCRTYRLLMSQRQQLVESWLPRFARDEIRFLARPTRLYALLLFESFHPNQLRNALRRERVLDRLWRAVPERPFLKRLVPFEQADILQGDIPLFTTHPDSRDLFSSQGERLPEIFTEPSLQGVLQRVQMLSEEDLAHQSWLIRASFTSLAASELAPASKGTLNTLATQDPVTREQLIEAACAVGERICQQAVYHRGAASWLGVVQTRGYKWDLQPADISLYNGNAGIALFLAYLGHVTGKNHYSALARAAFETIRRDIALLKKRNRPAEIGAFIGLGSVIYLLLHLGSLWREPGLIEEAEGLVALLAGWIERDERLDIVAGAASAIISLLNLYAVAPTPMTLAAAIRCGDHLLHRAQRLDRGIGWSTIPGYLPPAGFAHGAAGFAWSLLKLATTSGQERFRDAALAALNYERSLFSTEHHNWPVFQEGTAHGGRSTPIIRTSWVHGAPGIGLARLASLGSIDDPLIQSEIEIALETTVKEGFGWNHEGFGPNHSLSHGDFGNLETLLMAVSTLDQGHPKFSWLRLNLERITAQLLQSIKVHGWVTGIPLRVETAGLMIGLAGIGYELLRLAEPHLVPSVLLLAPPSDKQVSREQCENNKYIFV